MGEQAISDAVSDVLITAGAFGRSLLLTQTLRSRAAIARHHESKCTKLVADAQLRTRFYAELPGGFLDMPIIDKELQQARFADFNVPRIALSEVVDALERGEASVRGYHVGQSTGTSGNRGRYVISDRERFLWLGTILAKAIPEALLRKKQITLALPGMSALYHSASKGSRVRLAFLDLTLGIDAAKAELRRLAPDVLVAPPKVLRMLAEDGLLAGIRTFSGAEVLDDIDREVVSCATGFPVREIYMATEGLFGVACAHGTLHLAEDVVRFEWKEVPDTGLVSPIVTDLVRRVQPMIRYRMNDLLELSPEPCPCGSAYQAVRRVHGRLDDVFEIGAVRVTPDIVRNAIVDSDARIRDFHVIQRRDGSIQVSLDPSLPEDVAQAARQSLSVAFRKIGADPVIIETTRGIPPRFDRKLRRVERER